MSALDIKFVKVESIDPGFYLLQVLRNDNDYPIGVRKSPIVGWAYEENSLAPYPITYDGVQTDNISIRHPDGTVGGPYSEWLPNIDCWLKAQQQEYTEKQGGKK